MRSEDSLNKFADRVKKTKALRKGAIAFALTGTDGGDYYLDCTEGEARLNKGKPHQQPLIEVIGDAERVLRVLDGERNARDEFYAGGYRLRGDLRYLSDLALELGMIKTPL